MSTKLETSSGRNDRLAVASLKDVAAFTGLSIRTVSRVMSGDARVSEKTKSRVLDAAKLLDYRPNLAARALKTGESHEILAVIAPRLNDMHVIELGVFEQAMRTAGYTVSILVGPYDKDDPFSSDDVLDHVLERRPAGVAFFPECRMPLQRSVAIAETKGIPCIALDTQEACVDAVQMDRPQGVYEAVKYLASKGRRRIAYLGYLAGRPGMVSARTRLNGYEKAIAELGLEPLILPVGHSASEYEGGIQGSKMFLTASVKPDAIQAYSDMMAAALLVGLHQAGVRVPEEVAVVGFGDAEIAPLVWPQLTTVAQPARALAQTAAEVLLRKIRGEARPKEGLAQPIATKLVIRDSA